MVCCAQFKERRVFSLLSVGYDVWPSHLGRSFFCEIVLDGDGGGLGAADRVQFGKNAADMKFDGRRTEAEFFCDLAVGQAMHNERQNLGFAVSQPKSRLGGF